MLDNTQKGAFFYCLAYNGYQKSDMHLSTVYFYALSLGKREFTSKVTIVIQGTRDIKK